MPDDRFYPVSWVGERADWKSFSAPADLLDGLASGPALDIASGPEPFSLRFFRRGEITSLDINPNYCASCARLSVDTVLGDMRSLPFRGSSFGTVILRHALTHTAGGDDALVLREAKRVLASGGVMYIEVLGADDMRASKGTDAGDGVRIRKDGRVWRFYTMDGLLSLLSGEGLTPLRKREIVRDLPKLGARRHMLAVVARSVDE